MNSRNFFNKVSKMRNAQKSYFATRSTDFLMQSKKLEKEVDEEIERVEKIIEDKGIENDWQSKYEELHDQYDGLYMTYLSQVSLYKSLYKETLEKYKNLMKIL